MTKPISPAEFAELRNFIPDQVFQVVNQLLVQKKQIGGASLSRITVFQKEVVDKLETEYNFNRRDIYDKHMLDFEPHYREAGWTVKFDKPAYCESYEAYWTFSK
jgi:hypothetical protein